MATLPEIGTPVATLPEIGTPVATLPEIGIPVATLPEIGTPVATLPEIGIPVANLPEIGTPVATLPEIGTPVATLPEIGIPVATLPEIGIPVATLPGAWHGRVSAGDGQPSVNVLWLGEVESLICNFCLSVAACKLVWADLPWDTLACCWDIKQPTNIQAYVQSLLLVLAFACKNWNCVQMIYSKSVYYLLKLIWT